MDLTFSNGSGTPVTGVRVLFATSDTSVVGYRVASLPAGTTLEWADVNASAGERRWSPAVSGARAVLSLELLGEPLVVSAEVWRDRDRQFISPAQPSREQAILLDSTRRVW